MTQQHTLWTTAPVPIIRAKSTLATWSHRYVTALLAVDAGAAVVAVLAGYLIRFGQIPVNLLHLCIGLAIVGGWLLCVQGAGGYQVRRISVGVEESKRVLRGTAVLAAALAAVCFAADVRLARGFVLIVVAVGLLLMLICRYATRQAVHSRRRRGQWCSQILAVGSPDAVRTLVHATTRAPWAGLTVVGACTPEGTTGEELAPGVPVVGSVDDAAEAAELVNADAVALAGTALGARRTRELGWSLERSGRSLVMAPELTEVAGPRVHVSLVEGLPLMWVDQPAFTGARRIVKRALDLVGAGLGLLLALPVLLVAGLAVKATSPGPALYTQRRTGRHGQEFTVYKLRSMYVDADARRAELVAGLHGGNVINFKLPDDPRVTRVGRWLRRSSLDELPQLLNVLRGEMSLVGPRPQLGHEVELHDDAGRRRLLVKPGLTGLWQVSGRSDLTLEDGVRLDLYYVENWSLALDLAIIVRTVWAVVRSRGAY